MHARPGTSRPRSAMRRFERTKRVLICLIMGWLLLGTAQAFCSSEDDQEYEVKLGFLYNFTQFVEWPAEAFPDPFAPLTVCVAGENPFEGALQESLRGRKAGNHPIQIKRLKPDENPRSCHIIFIRSGQNKAAGKILSSQNGSSVLSVGEVKGFAERGGIVNLILVENKLHFEINLDAAARTRLKISSKMLALARIVREQRSP